jgi:Ca2+-transporting ATPase
MEGAFPIDPKNPTAISPSSIIEDPHSLPAAEVLSRLGVKDAAGLSDEDVTARRQRFGPNTITTRRAARLSLLLLHQFTSPVVYLLAAAAALAVYFGEVTEGGAIAAVLVVNALIGFVTELKAVRSIESLRTLGGRSARVRREGHVRLIPAEELVPGDIVLLDAGNAVSADLRLIEASGIAADESTLTGESVTVDKGTEPIPRQARTSERSSMLFKGTTVTRGIGAGVVVTTGMATELGRVTQLVLESSAGRSPLEQKLARLTRQLAWATMASATAIAAMGIASGRDPFLMVEAAIALAVAAIPEGLPIVATLALARGMWRMARQNALIERLSAVETLGATTIILTDKTGTLTENRMTVRRLSLPSGEIDLQANPFDFAAPPGFARDREAALLLRLAVLCNDAHLDHAGEDGNGDPMEVALLRAGLKVGLQRAALLKGHRTVGKHAFDSITRMMATVHESGDGYLVAVKGAPEAVIAASSRAVADHGEVALNDVLRAEWLGRAEQLAHHGLRLIACAMKMDTQADGRPYEGLVLAGLIGLEDPARADVPQAIRDCRRAGIRVVMVTGDHAVTARSIGHAVGLADRPVHVVEGNAIAMTIAAGPETLRGVNIFARVSPAEKLELVKAYQAAGDIVAMTGDGVNDAPALRQADIGVAMGLRGTDVAREAAAMILLDDAFPTIVKAIRQGRIIFSGIRSFASYLFSCNLSEVLIVGLAVASALPLPLLPLQILYLNLVTDVFPAFALAMGEGETGILRKPPRDPKEPILGRTQWLAVILQAMVLAAGTFAALLAAHWLAFDALQSVTVTFLTLAFGQLWHVFNMRSGSSGVFLNEVTRNGWVWAALVLCSLLLAVPPYIPQTADLLHVTPLTAEMWAVVMGCSLAPLVLMQLSVAIFGRHKVRMI